MNTPNALRIAQTIETEGYSVPSAVILVEAPAELRRQHAEIERLTAALDEARAEARVAYLAFEQVSAERDSLRAALMRVKTEAVSLADAQVIALEATTKGRT